MRNQILTFLALFLALFSQAQECLQTEITLSSYMNLNGPSWYAWDIMGENNQMFASGIAQFTPQLPNYPASACLPAGCYTLTAVAMTVIQPGSTFASFDPAGGYWSDYDVSYNGMAMTMVFCIAENQPCEIEVAVLEEQTCATFNLVATTPNDAAQIFWSINGEPYTTGGFFSWEASNPGVYQICAAFETPDCPEGVFWCETFAVSPECFENDCPYDFVVTQQECTAMFYLSGASDTDVVYYVNGEQVSNGELLYSHVFTQNGVYSVCAVYQGICDQTEFCQTVEVNACSDIEPCTVDFEVLPLINCGGYIIFPVNYPVGAIVLVEVNGVIIGQGVNEVLFVPPSSGEYEVCVYAQAGQCGQLISQCEMVQMTACADDCGMALSVNQFNCGGFVFDVQVLSGWQNINWTINGEPYGLQTWNQNIQFTEEGIYEICATYENAQCGFQQVCTTVTVENCVEGCTDFMVSLFSSVNQNGPAYVLYEVADENSDIVASGEAIFIDNTFMQVLDFCLPAGCYTIALTAPNGGFTSSFDWLFQGASNQLSYFLVEETDAMLIFEVCLEPTLVWDQEINCTIDVDFGVNNNGMYVFEVDAPDGAEVFWLVNGEEASAGNSFGLNTQVPGVYEVCAYYFASFCPEGAVYCTTVIVPDNEVEGCTEVTIEIANNAGFPADVLVNALLESIELDLGFDVTLYELSLAAGIGLCLPDGCYEFTLGWEEFALINLLLTVNIGGEVTLEESIDVLNQTVTIQLAINTDCSIGVIESEQSFELNLFPHPADQAVNLSHTFTGAVNVQIFDLNGRMVAAFDQLVGNTLQLPTAALSQGLYIVQVTDGNYVKQAKMQIQR